MSGDYVAEVIFQGSKCYWRTRNTVDIMLVLHNEFNVIEVITYEPTIDKEAPRIYLDNSILNTKIDQEETQEKLRVAKELILRRREVPNAEKLLKEIINNAKTDYILNRLFIAEFAPEKRTIKVEIQFNFRDFDDAHEGGTDISLITCNKPADLQRYKSPHYHTLMEGLVDQMLDTLDEEQRKIQLLRRRAGEYEDSVAIALTMGERWRIPIIFVKVLNGKPLKKSDKRIWSIVTREIAPGEATAKVAAALQYSMSMRDASAGAQPMPSPGKSGIGGRPRTQSNGSNGRRGSVQFSGGKTSTPSSLRRAGTQSGSMTGSTLSAGLSAMGASMKRRLGLTVNTDGDVTDEGGDDSFAESANAKASKKNVSPARTPKAKAPAEFVNPRGTNISITPKPRSFLPPPKKSAKPKDSGLSTSVSQSLSTDTRGMSMDVSTEAAAAGVVLNANEASNKFDDNASSKANGGLSARFAASFSSFSASMKRTFSYRTRASSTVAAGDVEDEQLTGENDDFNSKPSLKTTLGIDTGADNSAQRTHSDANDRPMSPGPTSPGPFHSPMSSKAGAHSKAGSFQHKSPTAREHSGVSSPKSITGASPTAAASSPASSQHFFGGAASAEEYRENMLKKQAHQTAQTYQALTTTVVMPAPGATEAKYTVSEDGAVNPQQASVSPIEQFFSSISPWGKSAKVVPDVPKGVSGSNLVPVQAQ